MLADNDGLTKVELILPNILTKLFMHVHIPIVGFLVPDIKKIGK